MISVVIAFIAIIVSCYAILISRKTMRLQALHDVQKDYRSAEMMIAIKDLWDFYRECEKYGSDLKEEFLKRKRDEDNKHMKTEETLNYKRRLLTHFYYHLSALHVHGILPKKMIFDWWMPNDFKMIDKFIIPLQEALNEQFGFSEKEFNVFKKYLRKLKEDCDKYYEDMEN